MQDDAQAIEREAFRLLPSLLAEVLDEERVDLHRSEEQHDRGVDALYLDGSESSG